MGVWEDKIMGWRKGLREGEIRRKEKELKFDFVCLIYGGIERKGVDY